MDSILEQQACNLNTPPEQLRALAAHNTELAQLVAANPNAEPDLLEELANRSDYKIVSAVAGNPNTPTDVLLEVGVEFPKEVLSNPIFPLLLLENPNLIEEIPHKTLESFLKVDLVPDALTRWVVNNKKQNNLLLAITMNLQTSKDILEQLINNQEDITVQSENTYKHVVDAARLHINFSSEIDSGWEDAAFTMIKDTVFMCNEKDVAAYKVELIPELLVIKFGRHIFPDLAKKWASPVHLLEQIAEYIFSKSFITGLSNSTLIALATNPNTPLVLLDKLVGEYNINLGKAILREEVICNPSIPLNIIQEFHSSNIAIQTVDTSSEKLRQLSNSQWLHIRRGVAYHPNTPVDVLSKLAEETDEIIHVALALNHNTNADILNKLVFKNQESRIYLSIIEAIICNINADEESFNLILKNNQSYHLMKLIAYHPNVTENILNELANIQSDAVLTAVATNTKTPTLLLRKLAKISSNSIRLAVAGNPNTPIGVLLEFQKYNSQIFSKKAIKNHQKQLREAVNFQNRIERISIEFSLSFVLKENNPETLIKLAQHTDNTIKEEAITNLYKVILTNPNITTQLLEQAAKIPSTTLEAAIIRHPNTSIEILKQFTKHSQANIRLLITKNYKTPINILKTFLEDKEKLIRESALAIYQEHALEEKDISFNEQLQIVQNLNTPSNILDEMVESKWLIIRERVALHPNTSIDILIKLAEDKARDIQLAVAQNPNTPNKILEKLAHRHKWSTDIHTLAVKNLISRGSERAGKFIGKYIKDSPFSLSRVFALLHPLAPAHLLIKNYSSSYWLERYAIAQNPSTPNYIREFLTQDANRIVRAAALEKCAKSKTFAI